MKLKKFTSTLLILVMLFSVVGMSISAHDVAPLAFPAKTKVVTGSFTIGDSRSSYNGPLVTISYTATGMWEQVEGYADVVSVSLNKTGSYSSVVQISQPNDQGWVWIYTIRYNNYYEPTCYLVVEQYVNGRLNVYLDDTPYLVVY